MYKATKIISLSLALILGACSSTSSSNIDRSGDANYSGFLTDYTQLKTVDTDDDSELRRFISKELKAREYNKLMLDPISFYPAPQVTETVSQKALTEISSYFNNTLAKAVDTKLNLVDQPGKDTLRIKMAITGVKVVDKELEVYQYIPIAFVLNAAKGGLSDMVVNFQIEAEVVDSLTGELLGAAVKIGVGGTLKNDGTSLTLAELKPLIDNWTKTMTKTLVDNM